MALQNQFNYCLKIRKLKLRVTIQKLKPILYELLYSKIAAVVVAKPSGHKNKNPDSGFSNHLVATLQIICMFWEHAKPVSHFVPVPCMFIEQLLVVTAKTCLFHYT